MIPASTRSTTMRSGTRSRASRRPDLRSSPTASSGSTTTSGPTRVHGLANTAPGRVQDSLRRRPHPPHAAAHGRTVSLQTLCGHVISRWRSATPARPLKQAVISPSALSLMYPAEGHPRLLARAVHRRSAGEHETEIRRCLRRGAYKVQIDFTEGRLAMKIDPTGRPAAQLHRPEQSGAVALFARRAAAHRRAHLPGRRPRFDAQRRRRLRRAAAEPVPAEGRQLLHRARRRNGSHLACSRSSGSTCKPDQRIFVGVVAPDRSARSRRPRRSAIASSRPRSTFRSSSSARPTTAASRRSATTPRPPATRPSRRSARVWPAPRSRRKRSGTDSGQARRRGPALLRSVALQNAASILLARQRAEQELLQTQGGAA